MEITIKYSIAQNLPGKWDVINLTTKESNSFLYIYDTYESPDSALYTAIRLNLIANQDCI